MLGNPLLLGDDGYQISRSVRLRSSASAYFSRTPSVTGNRQKFTYSGWIKRGAIDSNYHTLYRAGDASTQMGIYFYPSGIIQVDNFATVNTTAVFRDPSAWYHVVVAMDTTQAVQADRIRIYVNGVNLTTGNTLAQNTNTVANTSGYINTIGGNTFGTAWFDGYMTEINWIDGQSLTPASFGETDAITGVWKPKKYGGTYGTNGFYLNFSDNSAATAAAIGKDYSGNGNNWTPNNISVTAGSTYDSMIDTPTAYADGNSGRGNYAVLNPLRYSTNGSLSEANLKYSNGSGDNGAKAIATIGIPSGKWYWEGSWISGPSNSRFIVGFASSSTAVTSVSMPFERDGSNLSLAANDIANVAIDFDAGKIWYGKNGVWQASGDPATGANPIQTFTPSSYDFLYPGIRLYGASDGTTVGVVNFGQRPFAYTPPSGFKALNTQNLPEPTIKKGNQYFNPVLWTGNATNNRSITGVGFQPDLVWIKGRSAAWDNFLFDSVRGANKYIISNSTGAEGSSSVGDEILAAFETDGFRVSANGNSNANANTYVGWNWKEGATQGFDIVTYTGTGANRTVAHGLGVAPKMMIVKNRTNGSAAYHWFVYHASIGATDRLLLNTTGATAADSAAWNNTAPTSSVFSVGTGVQTNESGSAFVAYLFSEVAGFSKFGSYTGNGSSDGPFVFCGFRPRYVMMKRTDSTSDWFIHDTARDANNLSERNLYAQLSNAEDTLAAGNMDLLSNGFKLRTPSNGNPNVSGGTYIFAAFAETAFRYSLAR